MFQCDLGKWSQQRRLQASRKAQFWSHREQAELGKGKHRLSETGGLGFGNKRLKGNRQSCALSNSKQGRTVKLKENPVVAKSSKD